MRHAALCAAALLLATTVVPAQRDHGPPPSPLAHKCGSQIVRPRSRTRSSARRSSTVRFSGTADGPALDGSQAGHRHVHAGGSGSPRTSSTRSNRRFVAVMATPTKGQIKQYKLAPLEFIE